MIYRLKIETHLSETEDYIGSAEYRSLNYAVLAAETYKRRVWILNDESRIVAEWNGITWMTHGVKI